MPFPGSKPKITLDQYKEILELKNAKGGERPKRGTLELTYARLGGKFGVRPSVIVDAARRGIKRYDYEIWKEQSQSAQSVEK